MDCCVVCNKITNVSDKYDHKENEEKKNWYAEDQNHDSWSSCDPSVSGHINNFENEDEEEINE